MTGSIFEPEAEIWWYYQLGASEITAYPTAVIAMDTPGSDDSGGEIEGIRIAGGAQHSQASDLSIANRCGVVEF